MNKSPGINNSSEKNNSPSGIDNQAVKPDKRQAFQYNKMMDDSKHTEEADVSRSDFTDTHSQETIRNMHRISELRLRKADTLEIKEHDFSYGEQREGYRNLAEDDDTQRSRDLRNQKMNHILNDNTSHNVYTQEEEEKTHDFIKGSIYDGTHDGMKRNNMHERRVNTDGDEACTGPYQKKSKKKITTFQMKQSLPHSKINVSLALPVSEIFETFASVSKSHSFQIIEMDQNLATAVNKEPFSLKKMFMRCIPFQELYKDQQPDNFISAVRLQISVNEAKCCRKITLKGLYGDFSRLQQFISVFSNNISHIEESLPQEKKAAAKKRRSSGAISAYLGRKQHKPSLQNANEDDSDSEIKQGMYSETSSIYQIYKILSSDQYTLGKNVAEYIECFQQQYKSLQESAAMLPQPMEGILGLINDTVGAFQSQYNLGKENAKELMHYCRPSVEKYVFSKVIAFHFLLLQLYDKLFAMYAIKNEAEDRLFVERSFLIKRSRPIEVMQYLGINEKFFLNERIDHGIGRSSTLHDSKLSSMQRDLNSPGRDGQLSASSHKETESSHYQSHRSDFNVLTQSHDHQYIYGNGSTTSSLGLGQINKTDLPYSEAVKCMERIQSYQSPREKLQCVSESFGCIKTAIVDFYKGKVELNTMDDVLPLTIYVVAMADLSHIMSEYNIMDDYLRINEKGFDFERKLLTNIDVSIQYINHEWQL